MSYLQGTVVRVFADMTDEVTGDPYTGEVRVLIEQPGSASIEERLKSLNEVFADPDKAGRFYTDIDTDPAYGQWHYQFGSTGATAATERNALHVRKAIGA